MKFYCWLLLLTWQEEQQELSEVFKVRIGLATEDREQVDRLANEMDSAMSAGGQQREDAMRRNHIDNFARRHFQPGSPPVQYTAERLRKSLLVKNSTVERRASHLPAFDCTLLMQWWCTFQQATLLSITYICGIVVIRRRKFLSFHSFISSFKRIIYVSQ